MVYEPGTTTPANCSSRHPPPIPSYSNKKEHSLELREEDADKIVNQISEVVDAAIMSVFRYHKRIDPDLMAIMGEINIGKLQPEPQPITKTSISIS